MARARIFVSFDYDNDRHYKNLLVAWDKNDLFDFTFYDSSVTVPVNSENAAYIRSVIKQKIKSATHLLAIIGTETYKSSWCTWEIETAVALGKQIVAVKTAASNTSPSCIFGVGATWAKSFTFAAIRKAVESA